MPGLQERVASFAKLGKAINNLTDTEKQEIAERAKAENGWFTYESVTTALHGIARYLDQAKLEKWVQGYPLDKVDPQTVGVVMAGNIPLVGFHDYLSVLITGHYLMAKLSGKDSFLLKYIHGLLHEIDPGLAERGQFVDRLNGATAYIATGSDNSKRYFNYYFGKKPHLLRDNKTGVGIFRGKEDHDDFYRLGKDIFTYFGLGCRNVSKIYVPEGYKFDPFFEGIAKFADVALNHKYANNYDYHKSIYLVNQDEFLDNEFLLLKESGQLVSPVSVLFYEYYSSEEQLANTIHTNIDKIQCMVSKDAWWPGSIAFGEAQKPELWDYADGKDTLKFLMELGLM